MKKKLLGLAVLAAAFCGGAAAEELTPLPSVPDYTRGGGWGVAIGGAAEYETAYDGSDEMELEFEPGGAVQWRSGNHMFFWENIEAGWRTRQNDWLFQLGARYEGGREADDSDDGRLTGLDEVEAEIAGFGEVRWTPDGAWQNWLGGRIIGGGDLGALAVLAAGRRFGEHAEAFVYTTFADGKLNNRDFGVTAAEAAKNTVPYSEFNAGGGYRSAGLTLIYRRFITEHVEITASAGIEYYSAKLRKSPLARKNYEPEIGVSVLYVF